MLHNLSIFCRLPNIIGIDSAFIMRIAIEPWKHRRENVVRHQNVELEL